MNPTKLVRLSLALVTSLLLCGVARADFLINYEIYDGTGDSSGHNWSGQFQVSDLTLPINDLSIPAVGVSGTGFYSLEPVTLDYFGSNSEGYLAWTGPGHLGFLPPGVTPGLQLQSSALYDFINNNGTWETLFGKIYSIDSTPASDPYLYTQFIDPAGNTLSGTGGYITFTDGGSGTFIGGGGDSGGSGGSGGGVSSVPEPSSFAMFGIGGVVLGGYVWRKKKRTA